MPRYAAGLAKRRAPESNRYRRAEATAIPTPISFPRLLRQVLRAVLLIAIVVVDGGCALRPLFTREIVFTQQEMTERLAKRFPIERNIADLVNIKLTRPRLSFPDPERSDMARRLVVGVDLDVRLPLSSRSLFGQMTLSGIPRYDPATRAIYLRDAKLDRVRVDNMPDALSAALVKTATQVARESFEDKAIYSFDAADLKRIGLPLNPERIELRKDQLVLVLN